MGESFVQLPQDGVGKKLRTRQRTIGANTVEEQGVFLSAAESFVAYADAVVPAGNKHHLSIFNGVGSGRVVKLRKLFCVNLQSAAISGGLVRFDVKKTTAQSAGTALTAQKVDSNNANLPAQILVATAATITEGALLFPYMTLTEEQAVTQPLTIAMFQQFQNVLLESPELQELTLREGEGMTVKQITAITAGSLGWIAAFTVEA